MKQIRRVWMETWFVALGCLILFAGSCSESPDQAAAQQEATDSHHYEIPVSPNRVAVSGRPANPYKKQYDFNPEVDWFSQKLPVWEAVLAEFKGRSGLRYLEVGSYEGRSAIWMLENVLTDESSKLTCIDPFIGAPGSIDPNGDMVKQRFLSNVERSGASDRIDLIVGFSQEELRRLPLESFDIIYIDGDHRAPAVLEDAVLSWRLLKPGGLIMFDDYAWQPDRPARSRPMMAIDFFIEVFRDGLDIVYWDYELVARKRAS